VRPDERAGAGAGGRGHPLAGPAGALAFLTVIGRGTPPSHRSVAWFGPVGLLVGAVCGLVRWGAGSWWAAAVAAALTVAADLAVTGALHLDGLADSADGLLPHLARERRLAIMADPGVGAFAVAVVGVVLLLRWSALGVADVEGWHWVVLLAGIWCGARTAMALVVTNVAYARPGGGLAAIFRGASPLTAVVGVVIAAIAAGAGAGWPGLAGLAAGAAAAAAVVGVAHRRLGGFTGDVLGAAGMVFETVALVVVAGQW
jgi:adenosylcobinamide-GDP ribazoletransferase